MKATWAGVCFLLLRDHAPGSARLPRAAPLLWILAEHSTAHPSAPTGLWWSPGGCWGTAWCPVAAGASTQDRVGTRGGWWMGEVNRCQLWVTWPPTKRYVFFVLCADIVNCDLKSTLRVLYNLFTKYRNVDWGTGGTVLRTTLTCLFLPPRSVPSHKVQPQPRNPGNWIRKETIRNSLGWPTPPRPWGRSQQWPRKIVPILVPDPDFPQCRLGTSLGPRDTLPLPPPREGENRGNSYHLMGVNYVPDSTLSALMYSHSLVLVTSAEAGVIHPVPWWGKGSER